MRVHIFEGGREVGAIERVTQDSVSRLEQRSDLLLSTLRRTVAALGGDLSLVAQFPDRPPVVLSGIAENDRPLKRRSTPAKLSPRHSQRGKRHFVGGRRAAHSEKHRVR